MLVTFIDPSRRVGRGKMANQNKKRSEQYMCKGDPETAIVFTELKEKLLMDILITLEEIRDKIVGRGKSEIQS